MDSIAIPAADGSGSFAAHVARPRSTPAGAVVVIQEIFGVNHHIRAVCDRLAGEGYTAVAPALFDRQEKNFESGYTPDEIANARKYVANPDWGAMLKDTQAAIDELKKDGPVAIIGFCMGGTIAFLAARMAHRRAVRIGVHVVAACLVLAICFSRIYLGVHYPSDVAAGALLGAAWAAFCAAVLEAAAWAARRRRGRRGGRHGDADAAPPLAAHDAR